jgi:hypothetical protein
VGLLNSVAGYRICVGRFLFPANDYSIKGRLILIGSQPNILFGCGDEVFAGGLCRGWPALWLAFVHQVGNPHQIIGQHCSAHQNLEPLSAFAQTAFHPSAAK